MKTLYAVIAAILLLGPVIDIAQAQTKRGTTTAPFLEIGIGPRAVAMGEAFVACANDVSSMYWNPAGLGVMDHGEGMFAHTMWIADIPLDYAAVALNLGNAGVVGVSFYDMNSGNIDVTTEDRPEGNGQVYTIQDMYIGVSYARKLSDRFTMGGTLKYIHQSFWQLTASTIAFDGGLQYVTPLPGLTMGLSISNFGGELQLQGSNLSVRYDPDLRVMGNNDAVLANLDTKSWGLPLLFRFGLAYKVVENENHAVTLVSDVLYPNNNSHFVNVGAEYGFMGKFFIRGGFKELFLADREGGLTLGAGVYLFSVKVDYSYSDMGRLNSVQRISGTIVF